MRKANAAEVHAALADLDAAPVAHIGEAQRKRTLAAFKEDRGRLSDAELMFESLADLFGFDSEEREALHLFVARAMDKSPDDSLIFNEVDIGRQLEGDDDVTLEAFKRRTVRVVERIAARAARHGKIVLERIPGKWSMGAGKDGAGRKIAARDEKKVGARYRFHWPQAVAEGADIAKKLRAGNRRGRFRRAAEVVFDAEMFPACAPPKPAQDTPFVHDADEVAADITPAETFERVTGERPKLTVVSKAEQRESPQRVPRTVRRVKDNVALALRAARERDEKKGGGAAEFNRQAAWIVVEVVRTIEREQGGEDLDTGEAIRQAIELLQAVASDPAELSCIEASITSLDAKYSVM